ncbi:VOC family protein [Cytobacillus purgationiresistens]|uniref:Enzyme related to lactoylglutathione lyase n=1 Tax=Cytobacillus purgationiresistens TaxID=863449 RepID=A0ABU0AIH0_9BACI|nr:VOC family protein [Cytobacillus purgationiresistens]MDQ0270577.1 putative enzyme related to lactoylglutathione lyase [Cytobacillus purgationiresistens]
MGKVIGFELNSQHPEKEAEFYHNVFGWEVAEPHWGFRDVTALEGGINGGISEGPSDYPHGTRILIEVSSIDQTIEKAKDSGAMVLREKMEFDDFYLAYLVDPAGLGIGLKENK